MGVYERFREETDFDTLELASKLRRAILPYAMNEKHIPKRWRANAQHMIDLTADVRTNIRLANKIYAINDARLEERYKYQSIAIALCESIQDDLIDFEEILPGVTCDNLKEIVDLLDDLYTHLINWRKKDRVIDCE